MSMSILPRCSNCHVKGINVLRVLKHGCYGDTNSLRQTADLLVRNPCQVPQQTACSTLDTCAGNTLKDGQ